MDTHGPRLLPIDVWPAAMAALSPPPRCLWVAGPPPARPAVAIVGAREPCPGAAAFAHDLAADLARRGVTVLSGGAVGIDAAAHRGALAGSGTTCVVAGTGHEHVFPPEHRALYDHVVERGGSILWPFPPSTRAAPATFFQRNRVLVALADAVVVAQAGVPSGALNAAKWARTLGRPLFAVAGPPWEGGLLGGTAEVRRGARVVTTFDHLVRELSALLNAPALPLPSPAPAPRPFTSEEQHRVHAACEIAPLHADELARRTGLAQPLLMSTLLTLCLEDVLVEGPEGHFRRNCS